MKRELSDSRAIVQSFKIKSDSMIALKAACDMAFGEFLDRPQKAVAYKVEKEN